MGKSSLTHISTMKTSDFRHNEKSVTISKQSVGKASICFTDSDDRKIILAPSVPLDLGAVVDTTYMSVKALHKFYSTEIADREETWGTVFSPSKSNNEVKISDPVMFGYAVKTFWSELIEKHQQTLNHIGFNPNNGIGDLIAKIDHLDDSIKEQILLDIASCIHDQPDLHMVNPDKSITNLHVPNDVIIDASMPSIIRNGGKGWAANGSEADIKCVIPDSCYAGIYDETIKFCISHGEFNPATMGSVSHIGLMAKKAEEYGSHNTTFLAPEAGSIKLVDEEGIGTHGA